MKDSDYAVVGGLWQYDYGHELEIYGLDLTGVLRIDFGVAGCGRTQTQTAQIIGDVLKVAIPDELLRQNKKFKAYIVYTDEQSAKTQKYIVFDVISRPQPTDFVAPQHKSELDAAIGSVNRLINDVAQLNETASQSAQSASQSEISAKQSAELASEKAELLKMFGGKSPYVNEAGNTWMAFDDELQTWIDTGVKAAGENGKKITFRVASEYIQWQYIGDTAWTNLVSLASITGPQGTQGIQGIQGIAGKQVEFNVSSTHIQWRYVGDATWVNLVALADLKGEQGIQGIQGPEGPQGPQGASVYAVKATSEAEALALSLDNPNNIYYWE